MMGIALLLCYNRLTSLFTMTLSESMNSQEAQSGMITLPDAVLDDAECTVCPPDPDLTVYKHMFTIDSKADNTKQKLPCGYTLVSGSADLETLLTHTSHHVRMVDTDSVLPLPLTETASPTSGPP